MKYLPQIALVTLLAAVLAACGGGVPSVSPTSLTIAPSDPTVEEGASVALSVTAQPLGASPAVTWESDAPAVAIVSPAGVVTGVAEGTAEITATSTADTTVSDTVVVSVTAPAAGDDPDEDPVVVNCDAATPLSDNITSPTTLDVDCYQVTSAVTVSSALTIVPGTVLEFTSSAGLRISDGGSLRAEGTSANPITMTSDSGERNAWRGVGIFTSSSDNILDHVVIENAGIRNTSTNAFNYTNLYLGDNARVAISNSTFRRAGGDGNGVGIYVESASAAFTTFERNTFAANAAAAMQITSQQIGDIGPGNEFGLDTLPGSRAILVSPATIRESTTWPATDVPYRFSGVHIVGDPAATLEIEAGTTLEFASNSGLRVLAGALHARGTSSEGITFTSASGNPESWFGVGISSSNVDNALEYVTIEKAGLRSTAVNDFTRTNLFVDANARVAITNSTFGQAGGVAATGIHLEAASAELLAFDDNAFVNNAGPPIRLFSNQLDSLGSGNVFGTDAPFGSRYLQVDGATVTTDASWQAFDIPYRFFGNHFVEDPDATVTIEPGATLLFSDSGIRVSAGALRAIGTAGDRITFTSASGNPGGWRGITFSSTSAANALAFATLEKAGGGSTPLNDFNRGNLVVLAGGTVAVSDSAFNESSHYGMVLDGGTVTDAAGTPIDPSDAAAAAAAGITFSGNVSGNVDD